ncbi:unnamed protein product [Chilo suppressalis]|uniref:Metalloendopeptidase n=1 Tax=Chilo suppressalis TaxID=168631 RepID=A0ABN8EAW4_CHISP|nr:unnamed protein product [Chilo suppressalis]
MKSGCGVYSNDNCGDKADWSSPRIYVVWPNATVPFYINPEHFDHYQALTIMSALTSFAYQTCLKFAPSLTAPKDGAHVMVFENPHGVRKCVLDTEGHPRDDAHRVILGYDCLKSPNIDMVLMRALGFPFEHNRSIRDDHIQVLFENIETSKFNLFLF